MRFWVLAALIFSSVARANPLTCEFLFSGVETSSRVVAARNPVYPIEIFRDWLTLKELSWTWRPRNSDAPPARLTNFADVTRFAFKGDSRFGRLDENVVIGSAVQSNVQSNAQTDFVSWTPHTLMTMAEVVSMTRQENDGGLVVNRLPFLVRESVIFQVGLERIYYYRGADHRASAIEQAQLSRAADLLNEGARGFSKSDADHWLKAVVQIAAETSYEQSVTPLMALRELENLIQVGRIRPVDDIEARRWKRIIDLARTRILYSELRQDLFRAIPASTDSFLNPRLNPAPFLKYLRDPELRAWGGIFREIVLNLKALGYDETSIAELVEITLQRSR